MMVSLRSATGHQDITAKFRTKDPYLISRSYNQSASYQQMPYKVVKAFISVSRSSIED